LDAPDLWLWDVIVSPGQTSYTFVADHVSGARPAYLSVSLQGASDFEGVTDHHVRASVNGTFAGETTWDGKRPATLEAELPPGVVHDGTNVLELKNVGDTGAAYSFVFLDRFSVRYPRGLLAAGGTLEGSVAATGQAAVEGLLPSSVLLDTTDSPRWRRGGACTPAGPGRPRGGGRPPLAPPARSG